MLRYASNLTRWSTALQAHATTQAVVSCWGNSITEGAYSNDVSSVDDATWRTDGWVAVMRDTLATETGLTPGEGYIWPGSHSLARFGSMTGAATETGIYGYAGQRIKFSDSDDTLTMNLPACSSFRLHLLGGFGDLRYTVDGGSQTTVDTSASTTYLHTVSGLEDTTHTIVLTGPASGVAYLLGVEVRRATTGVAVHRLGYSGKVLADVVGWGSGTVGFINAQSDANKDANLASVTTALGVDLVVINFDTTDTTGGWTLYSLTPAQVQANVTTLLGKLDALGIDALLVTGPPRDPSTESSDDPQADYAAAYGAAAAASDNAAWLDLTAHADWATYAAADAAGYAHDTVHPSALGHRIIGRRVAAALWSPAYGERPTTRTRITPAADTRMVIA